MEQRLLRNIDFWLIGIVLMLIAVGLVVITSATMVGEEIDLTFVRRQLLWVLVGFCAGGLALTFDYRHLQRYGLILYGLSLGLLGSVFFFGEAVKGARRWIEIGPFSLQPSEFAKLLIIIVLADYLARREGRLTRLRDLIVPFLYVIPPVALVYKQPDIGSSAAFVAILLGMLLMAGARLLHLGLITGGGLGAVSGVVLAQVRYGIEILRPYQLNRLIVFLDPSVDPLGSGYHIVQSRLAVGSGRLTGQGLFQGQLTHLNFLPEQHTDFILTVLAEEAGFVGSIFVLLLFFFLLARGLMIAADSKDLFGALIVTGVVSMILFHIFVNVGMALGMMPVTGLPLPFVSYGGSAMITNLIGIALVLNVYMRRQKILF